MEILTIGERLMIYRKRAGLTKKELAERAGISVSTVTKYENDISNPDHEILSRMAIVLNVSVNKLILGFNDPFQGYAERKPDKRVRRIMLKSKILRFEICFNFSHTPNMAL
ncbi:MAG: helix-turn-helix transcriptional regulator [Clostridia bacterium]|nr:helix-turn-helix transcriptional regulator [Clostridia bacterium]